MESASPSYIYHLVEEVRWRGVDAEGYRPPTFESDGFIHATRESKLLLPVANHFYKGVPGKFLCLQIDPSRLASEVKYEAAAPVGEKPAHKSTDVGDQVEREQGDDHEEARRTQQLFPHIYGPINSGAVVAELAVGRAEDGSFVSISGVVA